MLVLTGCSANTNKKGTFYDTSLINRTWINYNFSNKNKIDNGFPYFVIKNVNKNIITGRIVLGENSPSLDFKGYVKNNKANCNFTNKCNNLCNISIHLLDKNKIIGTITQNNTSVNYEFKRYKVNDITGLKITKKRKINTKIYGSVILATGTITCGRFTYADARFISEENDSLCELGLVCHTATIVNKLKLIDKNSDGFIEKIVIYTTFGPADACYDDDDYYDYDNNYDDDDEDDYYEGNKDGYDIIIFRFINNIE